MASTPPSPTPVSFTLNDKTYLTDKGTLQVIQTLLPRQGASEDSDAVGAVLDLGLSSGRIAQVEA